MASTLYGLRLSYFSMKLDAALRWAQQPYRFVNKTNALAPEVEARSGTHQIPVVRRRDGSYLADTTAVFEVLDAEREARGLRALFHPRGCAVTGALVRCLEDYLDEWIPRYAVHYRWQYPESAAFAKVGLGWAVVGRGVVAEGEGKTPKEMAARAGDLIEMWGRKACNATGMTSAVQQTHGEGEVLRLLTALDDHLALGHAFVLGDSPCAVDATLMGSLRAHFLVDPVPRRHLDHLTHVTSWMVEDTVPDGGFAEAAALEFDATGKCISSPLVHAMLGMASQGYAAFMRANDQSLRNGDKVAKAIVFEEPITLLSRRYPSQSRDMTVAWMRKHCTPDELGTVDRILTRYGLADIYRDFGPLAEAAVKSRL